VKATIQLQAASFWRGFRLPFELVVRVLRDGELRSPYLRLFAVRAGIVAALFVCAASTGEFSKDKSGHESGIVVHKDDGDEPVDVKLPGLHVVIDPAHDAGGVQLFGKDMPVTVDDMKKNAADRRAAQQPPDEPDTTYTRTKHTIQHGWAWVAAAVAFVSVAEACVVFLSRRWDDWLSHYGARLAGIVPEDEDVKPRKMVVELRWLYRKSKRKIRGYVQFAIGIPLLLPFKAIPGIGDYAFGIMLALWGYYWLGVCTAGKSAHAWTATEIAPAPVRVFTTYVPNRRYTAPVRWYGRAMHRVTADSHAAAITFERDPAAFLGLALARTILAAPFLYLLARPIVPLAAGRLCAEVDPEHRFWLEEHT
jgi:hypothetical protein